MQIIVHLGFDLGRGDALQCRRCRIDPDLQRVAGRDDAVIDRGRFDARDLGERGRQLLGDAAQNLRVLGAQLDHHRLAPADHVADHVAQQLMGIEVDPRHLVGDLLGDLVHHLPDRRARRGTLQADEEIALVALDQIAAQTRPGAARVGRRHRGSAGGSPRPLRVRDWSRRARCRGRSGSRARTRPRPSAAESRCRPGRRRDSRPRPGSIPRWRSARDARTARARPGHDFA